MKTAILAIDATRDAPEVIGRVSRALIRYQDNGLFENLHVASVIHPDSYLLPFSFYREEKHRLAERSRRELKKRLDPRLKIKSVDMLVTQDRRIEDHVDLLDGLARSVGADAIIVGPRGKSTLTYLIQGSFTETAGQRSHFPVLVLKGDSPAAGGLEFAASAIDEPLRRHS